MTAVTAKKTALRSKGPEVIAHFGAVLADRLEKEGIGSHAASQIALNLMDVMKAEFGGQNIYFPMGFHDRAEDKSDAVYQQFMAGATVAQLAAEFGHSETHVYRLIANARAKRKALRSGKAGS